MIKLNEFYNRCFEQKIANSIFAVGGISFWGIKRKMKQWLAQGGKVFLDVGCGDKKWEKYVPNGGKYIALDYIPAAISCPWRVSYPHINADAMKLPIKNNSVDVVVNVFMLEHVKEPTTALREMIRVIKPGGVILLAGPGDILMSHGEPFNFYNLTKYAYQMLLEENNMRIIEEYYPSKSWLSIFSLAYLKIVRNNTYNKRSILKFVQLFVFLFSLGISPLINLLALALDWIMPFDNRGYNSYMVMAKKI